MTTVDFSPTRYARLGPQHAEYHGIWGWCTDGPVRSYWRFYNGAWEYRPLDAVQWTPYRNHEWVDAWPGYFIQVEL